MLVIKNECSKDYSLKCIAAILNSSLINHIFRTLFLNKDIYSYQLEQIPIPKVGKVAEEQLESKVHRILAAKKADPNADTSALEAEIDKLVYRLYDLTPEEIAAVESSAK